MKVYILYQYVDDYRCLEAQEHYTEVWGIFLDKSKADEECAKKNEAGKISEKEYQVGFYVVEADVDRTYKVDD